MLLDPPSYPPLVGPRLWLVPLLAVLFMLVLLDNSRNVAAFGYINGTAFGLPGLPWDWVTVLGDTLVALSLLLLWHHRRTNIVVAALLAALPATLLSHGLKEWLDVPRPIVVLAPEAIHVIGKPLRADAFPSGHTTTIFVLATVLALQIRSAAFAVLVISAATVIGLSRVVVGAHWPLDIAGGVLCGWLSGVLGVWGARTLRWQRLTWLRPGTLWLLLACALVLLFDYDSGYPGARLFEQALAALLLLGYMVDRVMVARRGDS